MAATSGSNLTEGSYEISRRLANASARM
jgi:hypothetical protein